MPEALMHKVMDSYFEWKREQDQIDGLEIAIMECECPEFGEECE